MRKTQKDKDGGGGGFIGGEREHRRGGWRKTESGSMRRRTIKEGKINDVYKKSICRERES